MGLDEHQSSRLQHPGDLLGDDPGHGQMLEDGCGIDDIEPAFDQISQAVRVA